MAETKGNPTILSHSAKTRFHSIGTKLLFFTVILLLAQYLIIAYKDWRSLKKFSENQIKMMADLKHSAFIHELNTYQLMGQILLNNVAKDEELIKAFAERDRKTLTELALPLFDDMKKTIKLNNFIFIQHPLFLF